jgi:hypothetical protein
MGMRWRLAGLVCLLALVRVPQLGLAQQPAQPEAADPQTQAAEEIQKRRN